MRNIKRFLRKDNLELDPYIPGKPIEEVQAELGLSEVIKMTSNENPLGPSPKTLTSMKRELRNAHLYPEEPCTSLGRVKEGLQRNLPIITERRNNHKTQSLVELPIFVRVTIVTMEESRKFIHSLKKMNIS